MSEVVPEGWDRTTVGHLLEDIADGGTPATSNRDYYDGDIPWIVIDDIKPQIFDTKSKISELGLKKSSAKLWGAGTIILSTGATIGKVGIAMRSMATKQGICGLVPGENANNFFLFHYLSSIEHDLNVLSQGSTIKETRPPTIRNIPLNLPPLLEQKKIAAILTSVDDVIETTQKQIDKLQDLKKATMNELLTKGIGHLEFKDSELGRIPKSWEVKTLQDLVNPKRPITYGIVQAGIHLNDGIPYIRVSDMKSNTLHPKDMMRTSREIASKFQRSQVQGGDIVYALRGEIGKVLMVPEILDGANLTQGTALISQSSRIRTEFLLWAMQSEFVKKQTGDMAKGSTFAEMTLGNLKILKIAVPDHIEQNYIANILKSLQENISSRIEKHTHLQSLKKSLMQDLLTGKVRVKVD